MNRYTRNNTKEEFNSCRNFLCPPRFTIRDISTSRGTYARLAISISRYKCKYLSVNPSQLAVSAFYLLSFFSLSSFFDTKFEILFFLIHGTNDYENSKNLEKTNFLISWKNRLLLSFLISNIFIIYRSICVLVQNVSTGLRSDILS